MIIGPAKKFVRSENNSTTSTLAAGATFTGTGEDISRFVQANISLYFEPNVVPNGDGSTAQGSLWFDFSPDGTNWDTQVPAFVRTGIFIPYTLVPFRYFRVRYINDGGADAIAALGLSETAGTPTTQTAFRLQVDFFREATKELGRTIDQSVGGSDPVTLTRTVLMGKNPSNVFLNAVVNEAGALVTGDFGTEVARGDYSSYFVGTKFGRNSDIDTTTTPEDITEIGGIYAGQPESYSPELVEVFSSSNQDTSAGTGARTVRITGLKTSTSTDYETEDIIMSGVTGVNSVSTWWRVNRVEVLTAGSGGKNAGIITVRAVTTTTNVFCGVPASFNQSQIAAYTVPFGTQMIIKRVRTAITRSNGSAGSATVFLMARETGEVYRAKRAFELQTGAQVEFAFIGGLVLPAGTDVKFQVYDVSDNNTVAEAAFEYYLIEV